MCVYAMKVAKYQCSFMVKVMVSDVSTQLVSALVLSPSAVAPRLLQRRPRRPHWHHCSPARGGETRARPETTRPCNSRLSGSALASCRATNRN